VTLAEESNDTMSIAILSIVLSLATLLFTLFRHRSEEFRHRDTQVKKAWDNFLMFAFENPDLTATPSKSGNQKRWEQYEYFVYIMLMRADDILRCFPKSTFWKGHVQDQIKYHAKYLADWTAEDIAHFTPPLAALIKRVDVNA
jgi:hypothetical protein